MNDARDSVWVVTVEGEPHDPVIGIFDDQDVADDFANQAARKYGRDILTRGYPANWERFDPHAAFFSSDAQ